ncbi:glycoside hydrolase family 27 protein [Actinomycetospora sp. TBRC 11914]|uniref:glycoside hydrolase family 27 protein n=1 Tax=Actinomycetospora sp. TBRC 11914 TaxID=2729387 RepID=UPI00145D12FF|nr:glycoside hydrolase family 27 protein [Actinomycetospora sp. TBRC 11914]NMO89272.1 glycoside hydrolase family 27 protein [Actinomycetospora sp. TBRC 11914]
MPVLSARRLRRTPLRGRVVAAAVAVLVVVLATGAADAPAAPLVPGAPGDPSALAATPPMGINDWNAVGCTDAFDEAWVREQADALVRTGLRDVGYRFVNLDDCWAAPQRDAAGRLVPDPVRFPHGIAALADYVHARGLRLGLYTSAGTLTCDARGFPASLGHETADAASFAAWGVDYVKEDDCYTAGTDAVARYTTMARALRATGRPMVLAVCDKGNSAPWLWAPGVAQLWRTTHDVADDWASVADIIRRDVAVAGRAGAPPGGGWNDPDMLEVGNGPGASVTGDGTVDVGLTPAEQATQMAVWSMLAAPLLVGTDVAHASPATLALLGDRALVAIDQDPAARMPAVELDDATGRLVLRRGLSDGSTAVSVTALDDHPVTVPAGVAGRDLVGGGPVGPGAPVAAHATVVLRTR